jgi:hypothetical protein
MPTATFSPNPVPLDANDDLTSSQVPIRVGANMANFTYTAKTTGSDEGASVSTAITIVVAMSPAWAHCFTADAAGYSPPGSARPDAID